MKVLFAGETWVKHIIHVKGFDSFTTSEFGEGHTWFTRAMEAGEVDLTHIPSHAVPEQFPTTLEELKEYDLVILSDIGSRSITLPIDTFTHSKFMPNRLNVIKEYAEQGGGFAMIGGYMSFQGFENNGKYKGTAIEEILPVDLLETDDTQEYPEGMTIDIQNSEHPIMDGIPTEWPRFLGYNKLIAKENANVLAEHEGNPFIITGNFGEGRTFAFASDLAPHWGPEEFIEWEYYNDFWLNVVKWLAKEV